MWVYDILKFIWAYHYIIVIIFVSLDILLKIADGLLDKSPQINQQSEERLASLPTPKDASDRHESSTADGNLASSEFDNFSLNIRQSQMPPFKSLSMTEADRQKTQTPADASRPVAVHYYYGKLIQVNSPQNIQVGDYNTIEIHESTTDDDSDDISSSPSYSEVNPPSSNLASQIKSSSCSDILEGMTDDQKSLVRTDSLDENEEAFDQPLSSPRAQYKDSFESINSDNSSPGLSEELFIEARFKIFKAAEEYRKSKEQSAHHSGDEKPKSKRFHMKRKK